MLDWPDEEWHNQHVQGKEMSKGLDSAAVRRAVTFGPGPLPGVCLVQRQIIVHMTNLYSLTPPSSASTSRTLPPTVWTGANPTAYRHLEVPASKPHTRMEVDAHPSPPEPHQRIPLSATCASKSVGGTMTIRMRATKATMTKKTIPLKTMRDQGASRRRSGGKYESRFLY